MNRSDLEQRLGILSDTLKYIDNFTETNLNCSSNAFNSNHTAAILAFKGLDIKWVYKAVHYTIVCVTGIIGFWLLFFSLFSGVIFSSIMLMSLLSNLLVLVVLFSANTFQQSSSFFFASLCLADLGITVFGKAQSSERKTFTRQCAIRHIYLSFQMVIFEHLRACHYCI